jgi:hypothetical protein
MQIRKYLSSYCGSIYDSEGHLFDTFSCREELLDFRLQVVAEKAVGYYVVFNFDVDKDKCLINDRGDIENHPSYVEPTSRMTRELYNIGLNDIHEYEYREFY